MAEEKLFYTVKEVIKLLGISRTCIYKLLGKEIPTVRMGKRILIPCWYVHALTGEPKKE